MTVQKGQVQQLVEEILVGIKKAAADGQPHVTFRVSGVPPNVVTLSIVNSLQGLGFVALGVLPGPEDDRVESVHVDLTRTVKNER